MSGSWSARDFARPQHPIKASSAQVRKNAEDVLSKTVSPGVVLFRPTNTGTGAHLCGEHKNSKRRPISSSLRKSTVPPGLWTQLSRPTAVVRGRPFAQ